jgi:glycosyltransferase involved in cell wall biosynthesis
MRGGTFDITLASPAPADIGRFAADIASVADRFVHWPAARGGVLARAWGVAGALPASAAGDVSAAGRKIVADLVAGCDVLVADFPHSAVLLPDALKRASVMFTHNVEAEILQRHAAVARGWRRLVWKREAAKMERFERDVLRRFDTVIAVSARDAEALAQRYGLARVARIDTGVDLGFYAFAAPRARADTVVFSGAMDSRSNIDGITFLLREVWPLMPPETRMLVVGRNPPAELVAEARWLNWEFTGRVEDIRPHLARGDVAVIPLRVGSGTRLKAFEAMAMGLPVVSTQLGVEGLGLVPGTHFVAADEAAGFAGAVRALLGDYALRRTLAETGRALLEARYGWERIGKQFEEICVATKRKEGLLF